MHKCACVATGDIVTYLIPRPISFHPHLLVHVGYQHLLSPIVLIPASIGRSCIPQAASFFAFINAASCWNVMFRRVSCMLKWDRVENIAVVVIACIRWCRERGWEYVLVTSNRSHWSNNCNQLAQKICQPLNYPESYFLSPHHTLSKFLVVKGTPSTTCNAGMHPVLNFPT